MAWKYGQRTGRLSRNGNLITYGYSGMAGCKNNFLGERIPFKGPIPTGRYKIGKGETWNKMASVMTLTPSGHTAWGRTGFRIHGDNDTHTASEGCVILPPDIRLRIATSGDSEFHVY